MLTVPLIGDQIELFPDNDSSNSLEHVLFPAATLISREADQSRRQYSLIFSLCCLLVRRIHLKGGVFTVG